MGSSDFLSEAAINDNSAKCYLPAMPNVTRHHTATVPQLPANLPWHFWLAFAPGDFYRLLCHYLHPINSEYIHILPSHKYFEPSFSLVCSLEAM